ncbi:MAG: family lipase [Marmoricola sp.]|nr:family lipase [Marmoricola sp.]
MYQPDERGPQRPATSGRTYVRFAALGDSATHGLGDQVDGEWRGWARILSQAIASSHDVSFCNVSVPGATMENVRYAQLRTALEHTPQFASLVVGINDTLRSTWDPVRFRTDLLHCAEQLAGRGACLLTVRFHDHGQVLHLPRVLRNPLSRRIAEVNAAYDEVQARFAGFQVDLGALDEVYDRNFWAVDHMHPSELGHRLLAQVFAEQLSDSGLGFTPPSILCTQAPTSTMDNVRWMVAEGAPWVGRRVRDLGPALARNAYGAARTHLAG